MASSSSVNYSIQLMNNIIVYLYRYGNPVICIIGNLGNFLSALIFFKRSWRKNVCVFYFIFCLFFNSMYLNAPIIANMFTIGYNINPLNSNVILCKVYFYISFIAATLSPHILILATIDRLLISSQNVDTRLYSSKRLAYFSISISIFFWIFFYFHILIKVNIQKFGPSNSVCSYDLSKIYLDFVSYSVLVITILYDVLMIVLIMFAFKNVRRIRAIPRQQRNQIRSMSKKDFQLLRCLFALVVLYILLSIFTNINSVYTTATKTQLRTPLEQAVVFFLSRIFSFIYYIYFCSNFLVFINGSKAFRHELKRMIYKMYGKELIPLRDDENRQKNMELNIFATNIVTS